MTGNRIKDPVSLMNVLTRPLIGSCADTEARLSDYVDGELATASARRLRLHFFVCRGCRRMHASFLATVEQVRALGRADAETPTPSLAESVAERIRHEPR